MKALAFRLSLSFTIILSLSLSILIHFYQDRVTEDSKIKQAQSLHKNLRIQVSHHQTKFHNLDYSELKQIASEFQASLQLYDAQAKLLASSYPEPIGTIHSEYLAFKDWQHPQKDQNFVLAKTMLAKGNFILARQGHKKDALPEIFDLWLATSLIGALVAFLFLFAELKPLTPLSQASQAGKKTPQANAVEQIQINFAEMKRELEEKFAAEGQRKKELETIFAATEVSMILFDADLRIQSINQAALGLLELREEQAMGVKLVGLFRNPMIVQLASLAQETQETLCQELEMWQRKLFVKIQFSPLQLPSGEGLLLSIRDLTQIYHLEGVRKEFVANVSHELKTPITSIQGFSETLLDGAMDDPQLAKKFLTIIHSHALRMSAIIEDLLALARIEENASKDELETEILDLNPIITQACQMVRPLADSKNIQLVIEPSPEIIVTINGPLMEQCIANLVSNGVKYSPSQTKVTIKAEQTNQQTTIEIIDQGEGIPLKDQLRIFERFYRVDKSRSRETGGTGLGLSIVKNIIKMHQGEISVTSGLSQGSIFRIKLPQSKNNLVLKK